MRYKIHSFWATEKLQKWKFMYNQFSEEVNWKNYYPPGEPLQARALGLCKESS